VRDAARFWQCGRPLSILAISLRGSGGEPKGPSLGGLEAQDARAQRVTLIWQSGAHRRNRRLRSVRQLSRLVFGWPRRAPQVTPRKVAMIVETVD
jgi:hypothetical protein